MGIVVLVVGVTMVSLRQPTHAQATSQSQAQSRTSAAQPTGDLKDAADRTRHATDVFTELVTSKDNAIPERLLRDAEAIIVIPTLIKGGFVAGAKHGKGIVSVRQATATGAASGGPSVQNMANGGWSGPAFIRMTGGSIGWQIGIESVDLVLLVMNRKGVDELLDDRFTLGGSLSLAAGPLGRSGDAATNVTAAAGVLGYSRAQGLFAGATLEGAAIKNEADENQALYGENAHLRTILVDNARPVVPLPAEIRQWQDTLARLVIRR